MKKALIILTVLLLVAGFVSLIFNDVHVLQDLRHSNWNRQRFDDLVYDTQQKFMDGFMDDLMDNFDDADEDDAHTPDASHKDRQAADIQIEGDYKQMIYDGVNAELRFIQEERDDFSVSYQVKKGEGRLVAETDHDVLRIKEVPKNPLETTVFEVTVHMPTCFTNELHIQLVNGSVQADALYNPVRLETVNADVKLGMQVAEPVRIETVNGAIAVTYDAVSMQNLSYAFHVINGMVTINGESQISLAGQQDIKGSFGDGSVPLVIESVNGVITLDEK